MSDRQPKSRKNARLRRPGKIGMTTVVVLAAVAATALVLTLDIPSGDTGPPNPSADAND